MSDADREKWDAKWAARGGPGAPSASVVALERFMPTKGRALDVAGGVGRHALWLARRGLDVTLVDVSPVALAIARSRAGDVPLTTVALDLDCEPLPEGPWDLVICAYFFDRRVYPALRGLVAPGGALVIAHPTIVNLERHEHPQAAFLLQPGELVGFAAGLEILHSSEGWSADGHFEALLVARKPL